LYFKFSPRIAPAMPRQVPLKRVSGLTTAQLEYPDLAENALAEVCAHFDDMEKRKGWGKGKSRVAGQDPGVLPRQMFEVGWSFYAIEHKRSAMSPAKSLDEFPHLHRLLKEAMLMLIDKTDLHEDSLNVICRRYTRGQGLGKHVDRKDLFGEDVFGCVLENTSNSTLEFERSHSWTRLEELPGMCFHMRGDARSQWSHGVNLLGWGQRVSITWRWFSPEAIANVLQSKEEADSEPRWRKEEADSQPRWRKEEADSEPRWRKGGGPCKGGESVGVPKCKEEDESKPKLAKGGEFCTGAELVEARQRKEEADHMLRSGELVHAPTCKEKADSQPRRRSKPRWRKLGG